MQGYQKNVMGGDVDLEALVKGIIETSNQVHDDDLHRLESMLVSQATSLQSIFTDLARKAQAQTYLKHFETYLGLALKAQAQSRATITALGELKNPRQATFVKQANIAHGPQQVNNGVMPSDVASSRGKNKKLNKTNYWRMAMGNSASGWSMERRQRQSQAIKQWKPWSQSTGPRTEVGKSEVSKNAYKGGHYAKVQELKRTINKEIMMARDRLNFKIFK